MRTHPLCFVAASLAAGPFSASDAGAQQPVTPAAPAPATAVAAADAPSGQKPRGFVLGAALGTAPVLLVNLSGTTSASIALRGGLLMGYKLGRLMLHLGLDYAGADQIRNNNNEHYGNVLFWLGTTGELWRSADQRAELLGSVRLGSGLSFLTGSGSSPPSVLVGYELLPGMRYYLHPSFAVQAFAGLGGQYVITTGAGSISTGTHSLAASVGTILVL